MAVKSIPVTLMTYEVMQAALVGLMRQISSMKKNFNISHGLSKRNWDIDIEGACGEMAVAKALNVYWDGSVDKFKSGGDIGSRLQVRTTTHPNGRLIVRDIDDESHIFLLVTGNAPEYILRGWTMGGEAKQEKYLDSPAGRPPAYFVPISDLFEIENLKRQIIND